MNKLLGNALDVGEKALEIEPHIEKALPFERELYPPLPIGKKKTCAEN